MRLQSSLFGAAALGAAVFGGTATAQTTFGSGCPGASGVTPTVSLTGPVTSGQPWTLDITSPGGIGLEYILIGTSNTTASVVGGLPLPFDLGLIFGDPAWTGCPLNVDADILILPRNFNPAVNGGLHSVPFQGYSTGSLYFQVLNVDPDFTDFNPIAGVSQGIEVVGTFGAGAQPGDLVITEIMQNPSAVGDSDGEYFEVFNTTGAAIDIEGWTLRDDDNDNMILDNGGAGIVVPAGGYFVLGNNGDIGTNGGVAVDFEWNGTMFLSNGADEIVLEDPAATEIDRVNYDGGATFPDPTGASMELDVSALDAASNDNGANWAESTCFLPNPSTDKGTPGIANDQCNVTPPGPGSGDLIFTEVMYDSLNVLDDFGEWFEVYNTTGAPIDMNGFTLTQGANSFTVVGSFVIPAGGYGAFLRDGDPMNNGGLDPLVINAYAYTGEAFFLGNSGATLEVFDASNNKLGSLAYDTTTFPDVTGRSIILDPAATQDLATSLDGTNWCFSTSSYTGDGLGFGGVPVTNVTQFGTPAAANDPCPIIPSGAPTGELVVTEFMANTVEENIEGQWFEIFNTTVAAIDIDGYILTDGSGGYHIVNNGGPLLVPASGRITLGASNDTGLNGGVTHDYAYAGLFIDEFIGSLVVADGAGAIVAQLDWNGNSGWPVANPGHSAILDPAVAITHANSVVAANWCKSYFTGYGTANNFATPAAANDPCPAALSGAATGELIVTEFLATPAGGSAGEYVEILNTTGAGIDIDGYILGDLDNDYHIIDNGGAFVVPAGGVVTLGASNDMLVNGGATFDYVYGLDMFLGGGTDEIVLANAAGNIVAEISYDNGISFPANDSGFAAGLDPAVTQDQAASANGTNWCQQSSTYGDSSNAGTPGAANDACGGSTGGDTANSGDVIVTEVMQNPSAVGDSDGEYFELFNTTGSPINIDGWSFTDSGTNAFTVSQPGGLVIPAGGFLVLGTNADSLTNGGVSVDYEYSSYTLGNGSDEIIVADVAATEICRVEWDGGPTFPDPSGASMNLDPSFFNLADSLVGANWCESSVNMLTGGDFGTPGAANEVCP